MILGARRIKALIRNRANGNSGKAQMLLRHYAMERLLERLSVSRYASDFVIKGGILVSSLIGIEERMTRDIDATVKGLELTGENVCKIFNEITCLDIGDGFTFEFGVPSRIMEDADYEGIRIPVCAMIEKTKTTFKIDISTGDAITPHDIKQSYELMFEDRSIELRAYNIETVLAEKIETILTLSAQTTRMRDFYDVYMLANFSEVIDYDLLRVALRATMETRNSQFSLADVGVIIDTLAQSSEMPKLWDRYVNNNSFVKGITWEDLIDELRSVLEKIAD